MAAIETLLSLLESRGDSQYGGEAVTQLEHALQAALLAEQKQADPELIVAALLHDVGHLLHDLPVDAPEAGIDDHHENSGWRYLQPLFPAEVTEPVRLHVAAKRYLCTTRPGYQNTLSEPSLVSLRLQGGLMSPAEIAEFESHPQFEAAVRLRFWDDEAKVPGLTTPSLAHYAPLLQQCCLQSLPVR